MEQRGKNWFFLFTANFLGIFNDNFLKHGIIFISMSWLLPTWLAPSQIIAAVSAALVIPYLLFSPLSGRLATKHNKQWLFRLMKFLEIPLMGVAAVAFYYQWVLLAISVVFLMGILSCLYSPAKYSLIRDIGGEEKAAYGSGMIEAVAFFGILIGTLSASLISDHYNFHLLIGIFLAVAVLGYLSASGIRVRELPVAKEESSGSRFVEFLKNNYQFAKQQRLMQPAVMGYAIFWGMAGLLQMNLILHGKNILQCSNSMVGVIMGAAALGIIAGCTFVAKLAKSKIRIDFVYGAAIAMTLLMAFILIFNPGILLFGISIFLFAFAGGFFQVPCLAAIQQAEIGRKMGDIMAYLNFVTFVFVLFTTLLFSLINFIFHDNSFATFALLLLITLNVAIYIRFFLKKE